MRKPIPLQTPPAFQKYDCHMCGACCRAGFAVVATEEERERILQQGWEKEPEFQGKDLFARRLREWVLNQNADGACIFLADDNSCRIHARFGADAKPFACRPYPFVLVAAGNQARVSLRFDCPSVAGNHGRPLTEHRGEMSALATRTIPESALQMPPPAFRAGVSLGWHELSQIIAAFDRILAEDSLDITRRMLACADLGGLLRGAKMNGREGRKLEEFLGTLTRGLIHGVAVNPLERRRPFGMLPPMFRQTAALYGRLDRIADVRAGAGGKAALIARRLVTSLRVLGGRGSVPHLRAGLPRARFADLERAFGVPDAAASEALTRYYRVKFGAMGFFGRPFLGFPFLEGAGCMLLTYPLILWFARLFAEGEGKTTLDADAIQRALRVVDRPHGGNSMALKLPSERFRLRFLSEHENLSTLIVWYGT